MDENKLNSIVSNFLEIEKKLSNLSEKISQIMQSFLKNILT